MMAKKLMREYRMTLDEIERMPLAKVLALFGDDVLREERAEAKGLTCRERQQQLWRARHG